MTYGQSSGQNVNQEALDENGQIAIDKLDGFAFVLGEFWTLGQKLKR